MERFINLIGLLDDVREKRTHEEFSFFVLNETKKLIPYDLALFWNYEEKNIRLQDLSGNKTLDPHGDFSYKLKGIVKNAIEKESNKENATRHTIYYSEDFIEEEKESFFRYYHAVLVFKNFQGKILGGILFQKSDIDFSESERNLLEEIFKGYNYTYAVINYEEQNTFIWSKLFSTYRLYFIAIAVGLMLFPVRLSVTAPAEIVTRKPYAITAPFDGSIESVTVDPSESVAQGDILAEMDSTTLQSRYELAQQMLKATKSNLSNARLSILSNSQTKHKIGQLELQIKRHTIEANYAQELLQKKTIKAPKDGVAIFSDINALIGKPVRTGQQIMLLANPDDKELLVRIPVDALIPISKSARIKFYLGINPLNQYKAAIKTIGYQPSSDADGLYTYKVRANIPNEKILRIGLKGHATIYGDWTVLAYSILRRPIITLRQWVGI